MKIAGEGDENDVIVSGERRGCNKVTRGGGASVLQFLKSGKCHNNRNYKNKQ